MNDIGLEHQLEVIFNKLNIAKEVGILVGIRFDGISELNEQYGYNTTSKWLIDFAAELSVELEALHKKYSETKHSLPFSLYRAKNSVFIFHVILQKDDTEAIKIPQSNLSSTIQHILSHLEMGSKLRFIGAFSVYPNDATEVLEFQRNILNILHEAKTSNYSQLIPFNNAMYNQFIRHQLNHF